MAISATTNGIARYPDSGGSEKPTLATKRADAYSEFAQPAQVPQSAPATQSAQAAQAEQRTQLNVSIVQASLEVSISSQNDPLALVYKSAIESLNDTLKADFGENAIQAGASQDNSPEGTAGRIVSLTTAFFDAFKRQHPGEDEDTVLQNFMDTIGRGIEQGFKEAREILTGLNVLKDGIAGNVDKTYELVQKGLADFKAAQGKPAAA